jgi:hypothetical protein
MGTIKKLTEVLTNLSEREVRDAQDFLGSVGSASACNRRPGLRQVMHAEQGRIRLPNYRGRITQPEVLPAE